MKVYIRWMIRRDFKEILDIDGKMSEDELLKTLRDRETIGMVAEIGDKVIGFMIYKLREKSISIKKLIVHSDYRRMGIGTQMVEKQINKLSGHRRKVLTVKIDDDNLVAQLFFRKQKFLATKVLKRQSGDIYLMKYVMEESFIGEI